VTFSDLPAINASLNGLSGVLLVFGLRFILRGKQTAHRNCMVTACCSSLLFLVGYLTYHTWMRQKHGVAHTVFQNPQWFRPFYLTILYTHLVAAIVILPLIVATLVRALSGNFTKHKKIARWTWPLWMYVSVTGVLIYLLLYQIYPQR
jgi:putative membrane protein